MQNLLGLRQIAVETLATVLSSTFTGHKHLDALDLSTYSATRDAVAAGTLRLSSCMQQLARCVEGVQGGINAEKLAAFHLCQ